MLKTVEATIDKSGQINWSEPVQIEKSQKILITFLELPIQDNVTTLDEVAGCLNYQGEPKTIEDMDTELAKGLSNEKSY
ncbi:hypothetical protein QUF74_16995 [Candidatus Halobeggiatoa sp. HSG11]|nr:hypothetical protein [Candidatus Halobeggiatoa sp. HSG11]